MLFAVVGILASTARVTAFADQSEAMAGTLNFGKNAISQCQVITKADGPHLRLAIRGDMQGDAIHLEDDEGNAYDYIFGYVSRGKNKRRMLLTNPVLEHATVVDIALSTAAGLKQDSSAWGKYRRAKIFTKPGKYTLYLGYSFRSDEEAMLGGVCAIAIQ
jgi:hypothetical protein